MVSAERHLNPVAVTQLQAVESVDVTQVIVTETVSGLTVNVQK